MIPVIPIGSMVGYPDILIATNTDGAHLGINLGPNVDFALNDSSTINAGVIIGLAGGHKKADDLGLVATAIIGL